MRNLRIDQVLAEMAVRKRRLAAHTPQCAHRLLTATFQNQQSCLTEIKVIPKNAISRKDLEISSRLMFKSNIPNCFMRHILREISCPSPCDTQCGPVVLKCIDAGLIAYSKGAFPTMRKPTLQPFVLPAEGEAICGDHGNPGMSLEIVVTDVLGGAAY